MKGFLFSTTVNEAKVLKILKELYSKKSLNTYKKVKQQTKLKSYFKKVIHEKKQNTKVLHTHCDAKLCIKLI